MGRLLFIAHRVPYPPNKGDKISTFNMLKYFSGRHDVFFGAFVDDKPDWDHVGRVRELCQEAYFTGLQPSWRRLASLRGLLTGEPLTLPYYRDSGMRNWVARVLEREQLDAVLIYSSALGQYATKNVPSGVRVVFNIDDVDSEKWRAYARHKPFPMSWIYRREGRKLLQFERLCAAEFDATVLISAQEAEVFRDLAPEVAHKVFHRNQGVDTRFFDPALPYSNPYGPNERVLVFVGAMDYYPNIDAVTWFAKEAFPAVRAQVPEAAFYIVGLNPADAVLRLAEQAGVTVTGAVPDVRPYVRHSVAACLPLRISRGIQNKAIEAMALERPILASPAAMAGIDTKGIYEPILAEDAKSFTAAAIQLVSNSPASQPEARRCVLERYDWETHLKRFEGILFERVPSEGS